MPAPPADARRQAIGRRAATGDNHYLCLQKSCAERRKSIRRDKVEDAFERLLRTLRPSRGLIAIATAMFRDVWESRFSNWDDHREVQEVDLRRIKTAIGRAAKDVIEIESTAAVAAIEREFKKLESQKALIAEDLEEMQPKPKDFNLSFQIAMESLANP